MTEEPCPPAGEQRSQSDSRRNRIKDAGSVNIRGVLTFLFRKSLRHRQVEKQTKEESSRIYQC